MFALIIRAVEQIARVTTRKMYGIYPYMSDKLAFAHSSAAA